MTSRAISTPPYEKEMSQLPPLDQLIAYVGEKTLKTACVEEMLQMSIPQAMKRARPANCLLIVYPAPLTGGQRENMVPPCTRGCGSLLSPPCTILA